MDALAHEPALHVREGDHERVDPAVADHLLQLEEARVLGVVGVVVAHRSSLGTVAGGGPVGRSGPALQGYVRDASSGR